MQKSKAGRSLFDLLSRDGSEITELLREENRWSSAEARVAEPSEIPTAPSSALRVTGLGSETGEDEAVIAVDGNRLRISLTPRSGAVAVFAVLLVLVAAFAVGTRSGRTDAFRAGFTEGRASYAAETMDEISLARGQPPATELVADLMEGQAVPAPEPTALVPRIETSQWIRGHTYIVAQEFAAGRLRDAEAARVFLAEHGIPTELVTRPGGTIQAITSQGFDRNDSTQRQQSDTLKRKLHAIGRKYFASGGGYKLEGYFKTLTGDNW